MTVGDNFIDGPLSAFLLSSTFADCRDLGLMQIRGDPSTSFAVMIVSSPRTSIMTVVSSHDIYVYDWHDMSDPGFWYILMSPCSSLSDNTHS